MRTIAISNFKGGSAKSTTAVNLAAALAEKGLRVLVIDLDGTQGSASRWLTWKDKDAALYEALVDGSPLENLVQRTPVEGVDLIPASPWLTEKRLAGEEGGELLLARGLSGLPDGRWDFVLVDTPPGLGSVSIMALSACRELLVPVEARFLALEGMASLLPAVDRVRDRLNADLKLSAILPCRVDKRTNLSRDVVVKLRERFGEVVLNTVIRENVRVAEAPSFGQPITAYASDSAAAQDYRAAAEEVIGRAS